MAVPLLDPRVKEFIAGFFDGDGTVGLYVKMTGVLPKPSVYLDQASDSGEPEILAFVQKLFGGSFSSPTQRAESTRTMWRLYLDKQSRWKEFLEVIANYAILKAPQAAVALNHVETHDEKLLDKLKQLKKEYHLVPIQRERITWPYLAGLFAADGCVGVWTNAGRGKSPRLNLHIAKRQCEPLLRAFLDYFGAGSINAHSKFLVSGAGASRFAKEIRPFLIGPKARQIDTALSIRNWEKRATSKGPSKSELQVAIEASSEMKRQKRE
jgi:hypothetical protein